MILKSKIYLKPGEKPPKAYEIKRGPKGGLYYETEVKVSPAKAPDLKTLHIDEIIRRLPKLTQDELYSLINDERYYVRSRITERLDQKGLHQMIHDKEPEIRVNVAKRIDQKGLHQMIDDESDMVRYEIAEKIDQKGLHTLMRDKDEDIRKVVAEHINQSGLHKLLHDEILPVRRIVVSRIDVIGLSEMLNDDDLEICGKADSRLFKIAKIDGTIQHYNKTGEIELTSDMKNQISKIVVEGIESTQSIGLIDEFYKHTPFSDFHQKSKNAWEVSSSSDLSGLLKDSILRQFGGKIRHHNAITDWKKFTEDLYAQYPKEMVDKYVQTHKKLTRKMLDVMFPDQDEIMVFRGTTKNEAISEVKYNERVLLQANPLSSWTQRHDIALKFANKEDGITVRTLVHKDDIWSTFMSHAYQGMEREFLVISPKDRDGEIIR